MTFSFRSLVLKATAHGARELEAQIAGLRSLVSIESAAAVLDQLRYPRGAFRLQVHLAVPGPDLRAESAGYTVEEAVLKIRKNLLRQIQTRRLRRRDQRTATVRRMPTGK